MTTNNFHLLVGGAEFILAIYAYAKLIFQQKRASQFKIKLALVYSILLILALTTIFSLLTPVQHGIFFLLYTYSLTLLYIQEAGHDYERMKQLWNWLNSITQVSPDMFWIKDAQHRFIYTNKTIRQNLLLAENEQYPIGKDGVDIAKDIRSRGIHYTAGEICLHSDEFARQKGDTFQCLERFVINDKPLDLDVRKTPLYNEKKEFIGTVGTGRDVTEDLKEFEKLIHLCQNKHCETFQTTFKDYIDRREFKK